MGHHSRIDRTNGETEEEAQSWAGEGRLLGCHVVYIEYLASVFEDVQVSEYVYMQLS
jgi:hypothetical protein